MRLTKISTTLIIFLLILTGCKKENDQAAETKIPVRVFAVKPDSLTQYLKIPGTITAGQDAIIYSKVSERIDKINVKSGDRVNTNQVLASQYNEILNQGVEAARAALNSAEAQLDLVTQDLERVERLYKQRAVSTQQYEQLVTQKKAAEANVEALSAQLQQAREQFQNSLIKAPFSGMVAAVYVENNDMVPAGQPVVRVINPSSMKGKGKISGRNIEMVRTGQEVIISVPSVPGKQYNGRVSLINKAVDPVTRNLDIEVIITDADESLRSGMHGEFLIAASEVRNAAIVPENALLTQTEIEINRTTGIQESVKKYFLFVVNDNTAHLREVSVGLISEGRAEITAGLEFSDKVITVGNNIVLEGDKVNIIE